MQQIMMASASSSNSVEVAAVEDDVDHRVSRGSSMTTDVNNYDDSLRKLEEGHCIQMECNQLSDAKNNNADQRLVSEEEAVALQAFNKACGEQSRSSSFCSGNRSNSPSRTSSSSSSSTSALPCQNGNNRIEQHVSTLTKIKLDTIPKKSTQYALDNSHNSANMDDLNISLNSDDLRNPGGFDGSMSISDLLMGSSKVAKTHHFDSRGSSGYSFHSNGSNNNYRSYSEGSNNGSSNSDKLKMGNRSNISSTGSSTESRNNKFVTSVTGLLRPISKRRREQDMQDHSSGINRSNLDRSSISNNSSNNWKDSSAISMNSFNSKDTNNGSILNPSKKKQSRVSWQVTGEDLDQSSNYTDTVVRKPNFIDSNNNKTTPNRSTRRRGSSWSIADLESMHYDSPSVAGDPSSVSIKSALTPEEQQLWTSMLQLANLSTNLNEANGENGGNRLDSSAVSTENEMSIQDMMQLASETILQSSTAWEGEELVANDRPIDDDNNDAGSSREVRLSEVSSSIPPQSHQTESPIEITPATAVAVTRLAYQEVEEYSARLRRKRAEMDQIDGSSFSSRQRQEQSPSELNDLNTLLLENATNINHAVLLQRALYALRIHRGSLMDENNVVDSSNNNNVDTTERQTNYSFSRSENSGLDHLALNHLLTLSPSVSTSGINMSGSSRSSSWRIAAQNAAASLRNQPSSSLSSSEGQRRHTDLEPQIGAYHQNEPAPLLFRRTFANPNRRESRQASRRATMDALNGQRMSDDNNDESTSSVGQQTPRQLLYQSPSELSNNEESRAESSPTDDCHDIENSITAQVTAYNPDDSYNRRSLGTLIESNQSQQSHQSASSIMSTPRNALLTAQNSFRRRSLRARQMIQAVLVSDEVVEAVEAEHIPYGEGCLQMEELLEEKEEEARMIEEKYKRREVRWMIVVTMLVVVIGVLIVAVLRKW